MLFRSKEGPQGLGARTIACDRMEKVMKFVCSVCGYVEEFDGEELPADFKCPQCGVSGDRFIKQSDTEMTWAA